MGFAVPFEKQPSKPGRLVVFAPHADDEALGAAGAMALATQNGWEVTVVFGTISSYVSKSISAASTTAGRIQEAEASLKVVGVTDYQVLFEEEHHLRLDALPQSDIVSKTEQILKDLSPDLAIIPSRAHHHQDHRAMADACLAAMRPMPNCALAFVPQVWSYGGTTFGWGQNSEELRPNVFVDITSVFDKKIESLLAYKTQIAEPPHSRSIDGITGWAVAWGSLAGVAYAEAFECLRWSVG